MVDDSDAKNSNNDICSSSNNLSDRCTVILSGKRSETAIKVWQRRYCEYHISLGHAGYCYAWLDNAFCPQFHLTGSCRMLHDHPNTWTREQKAQHSIQIDYMKDLWKDSSLFEMVSDGDNDSENGEPIVSSYKNDSRSAIPPNMLPMITTAALASRCTVKAETVYLSDEDNTKRRRIAE